MARRKKSDKEDIYDRFNCTIDSWRRDYSFGIKRWEIPGLETDKPFRESDHLVVTGTVVNYDTNRKLKRRSYKTIEINLVPTHVPREDWRKNLDTIGHTWTERDEKGILHGTVHLPADAYYSLIPCLAINHFREFTIKVLNLHYSKGSVDEIDFDTLKESIKFPD